jgi:broad specificity polyphosphatase/5'/3'-nucleotidase SurE
VLLALKNGMPKGNFWNVNFPDKPTDKVKVVETFDGAQFPNRVKINEDKYSFIPEFGSLQDVPNSTDVKELSNGFITFTPCRTQFTDQEELGKFQAVEKKLF